MNRDAEERASELSGYLDRAVRQQLGTLNLPPAEKYGDLAGLWLSSDQIARVVSAAQIPLIGWTSPVEQGWLASYNPTPYPPPNEPYYDVVMYGPRRRGIAPVTTTWGCLSPGTFRKFVQERENLDVCEDRTFRFREDGSLVRTSTYDYITRTFTEKDVAVQIRHPHDASKISEEDVFSTFVALLHAVDGYQLSLRGLTPASLHTKLNEIGRVSLRLAQLLGEPEVKILRGVGAEALELVCKHYHAQVRSVRTVMRNDQKVEKARIECIGPLWKCFALLFGEGEKRKKSEKGSVDPGLGPFVRLATAFFHELGSPCQPNTVRDCHKKWRKSK